MYNILIVEDEIDIADFIKECLIELGYHADAVLDGMAAVVAFDCNIYDLILLDIMIPKLDGFAVCELIRQKSNVPIIMLTAMGDEESQIKGFDLLIDDYIFKPFSVSILLKRIEAVLRRSPPKVQSALLKYGNLTLDTKAYEVYVGTKAIILTSIEFKLLKALLLNKGNVLSREQLLELVWGHVYTCDNDEKSVTHHIMNLRKKIDNDYIQTIRGAGYRIG